MAIKIYHGDCRELIKSQPDNSIDLIYTDPPYAKKYVYLYEWLAEIAPRVLKEDGYLLTYAPPYWKDVIMDIFRGKMYYFYDYILLHKGNTSMLWARKIISGYKSILAYSVCKKPKKIRSTTLGLYQGIKSDKRFHKWGQSEHEARYYIGKFSDEGSMVLDPFMGGGTTGAVCKRLKRNYIGFEIEEEFYRISKKRIAITDTIQEHEQLRLDYGQSST